MTYKLGIACFICLIVMFPIPVASESSNLKIDVYYNDQLYPGASTPKPLVKIGEPFTVRFDVTCFSPGILSVKLTELADGSFEVIDGPTLKVDQYTDDKFDKNETISYEWTLKPTNEWVGGSMPLDFVYQLNDFDTLKLIVKGEFTAAYVTISEEYYDGPETTVTPTGDSDNSSSPTTPVFTALCAVFVLVVVVINRKR